MLVGKSTRHYLQLSSFDLGRFAGLWQDKRKEVVFMARTAEAAERYEDMCKLMKELVDLVVAERGQLSVEERNLLSVAYKNVIGTRRASWRTLHADAENEEKFPHLIQKYNAQVESELLSTCKEVLTLLDRLIPTVQDTDAEPKVFYLKMAGDYYRYLAESVTGDNKQKAKEYYSKANDIAKKHLQPTHPIRLGLALNFSVCYYEILKDKKSACDLVLCLYINAYH